MASTQIHKVIERLGFSEKEAKVYLAALSLGECHISDIAKQVKLPRTSVQGIVDRLHKEGLMNFYSISRYKYWVAEDPTRLLVSLQNREAEIKAALPKLVALKKQGRKKKDRQDVELSLNLFRMLADTLMQPVLITNGEIEIEYVNTAWEKQFGYTLDEVKGQNPRILKSGKTPRDVHARMWKNLNAEKFFQTDQVVDMRKDGTCFNLLTTIFPTRHNGNVFFIQILDDATQPKRVGVLQERFAGLPVKSK